MNRFYLLGLTGMNYGNANTLSHDETGEEWVIKYIEKSCSGNLEFIFFDVGANSGNYSILLSQIFKKRSIKIYAFEPSNFNFNLLSANTSFLQNIETFNFGFGETEENKTIYSNYEGSGATSLYNTAFENYTHNKKLSEQIHLTTLDLFCSKHAIEEIDFLKIDVEGHELRVLSGALEMINKKKIKFIQFEFGPFHIYSKTFFKDFWDLLSINYKIYRIIRDGIFEIASYNENLEIFRTANFFAELKESSINADA